MANKQVNALTAKSEIVGDDLIPVYDSEEAGVEKLKKATLSDLKMVKWNPLTGAVSSPCLIVPNGIAVSVVMIGAPESAPYAPVSAADFIMSVIENGDPPYLYGLNRVGDMPDVSYADPRDAILLLDCTDVLNGYVLVEVHIKDNSSQTTYTETYVFVQDPYGLCPAP